MFHAERGEDAFVGEILIPEQQVADGREQASRADDVFDRSVLGPGHGTVGMPIGQRPIGHDRAKIVTPARVFHAERGEDAFVGERLEGLAIAEHTFDQDGDDVEAGVSVAVRGAGVEVERALCGGQ